MPWQWTQRSPSSFPLNSVHSFLLKWVCMKVIADILLLSSFSLACRVLLDLLDSPIFFLCRTHCWSFMVHLVFLLSSSRDMIVEAYRESAIDVDLD